MIHFLLKCSFFPSFLGNLRTFLPQHTSESLQPWRQNIAVGRKLISSMSGSNFAWSAKTEISEGFFSRKWKWHTVPWRTRSFDVDFWGDGCWLLVENGQKATKNSTECFSVSGKTHPKNFFAISASLKKIEIQLVSNQRSWVESFQMAPAKEAPAWYLPPGGWGHEPPTARTKQNKWI